MATDVIGITAWQDRWHDLEKQMARHPIGRLLSVGPRTTGYVVRTVRRQIAPPRLEDFPRVHLTPALIGSVALDEAILQLAMGPDRFPRRADYERVSEELSTARELYRHRGWIDDPYSYHRAPPPLGVDDVQTTTGWAHGLHYERIWFPSEFEPHEGEPGARRWLSFHTNRTAGAWVLRHRDDEPRPWLVCCHGFGMGHAFMEFPAFHAAHLHHDLGLNLVGPTLPVHGHRKVSTLPGDELLSFDLMNGVHGLTQAVWDVRRVISWVRAQDPAGVGLYGFSLGGYVAGLLAAFEADLEVLIAGVPISSFPELFNAHSPAVIRHRAIENGILGGPADEVHRVVSPLALNPVVPADRRYVFAGQGDRVARPQQAYDLWQHWGKPPIRWYAGNHIGFLWSNRVRSFIDQALTGHDFAQAMTIT